MLVDILLWILGIILFLCIFPFIPVPIRTNVKVLGVLVRDCSKENLKRLFNKGYNGITLDTMYFWDEVKKFPEYKDKTEKELIPFYFEMQDKYVDLIFEYYLYCIGIGFDEINISTNVGLYPIDENKWWVKIVRKFQGYKKVWFDNDETYNLVESGQLSEENLVKLNMYKKSTYEACDMVGTFSMQTRLKKNYEEMKNKFYDKYKFDIKDFNYNFSSYLFQCGSWYKKMYFAWITADFTFWHFYYSFCYWLHVIYLKKNEIDRVWIYQGNLVENKGEGRENYILDKLGLLKPLREFQLNKAVKYFRKDYK